MTIAIQFKSVIIQPAYIPNTDQCIFSLLQHYQPVKKYTKRKSPGKKPATVASLIDTLLNDINTQAQKPCP